MISISFYIQFKTRAGLKTIHRHLNGYLSVYRTIMSALLLKDIITTHRLVPIVVPGYRFNIDIALFSAILIADLKQTSDKDSLKKCKKLLERPSSLEKLVSATFRPFVGNMVICQTIYELFNSGVTFTRRMSLFEPWIWKT